MFVDLTDGLSSTIMTLSSKALKRKLNLDEQSTVYRYIDFKSPLHFSLHVFFMNPQCTWYMYIRPSTTYLARSCSFSPPTVFKMSLKSLTADWHANNSFPVIFKQFNCQSLPLMSKILFDHSLIITYMDLSVISEGYRQQNTCKVPSIKTFLCVILSKRPWKTIYH